MHSIDQGPKKSESEGAENGPFPHTAVCIQMRSFAFEDQYVSKLIEMLPWGLGTFFFVIVGP